MWFIKYDKRLAKRFKLPLTRTVLIIIIEDTTKITKDIEGFVNVDLSIISDPIIHLSTLRVLIVTRTLLII